MKKYIISFCVFILLILSIKTASAQSAYQIYINDIQSSKNDYQVGETVDGVFKLYNVSDLPQSDIYYTISSGQYSEENLSLLSVVGISEKVGPLYIKAQSQDTVSFSYKLPASLSGSSAIQITATLKDGTLVAQGDYPLQIKGESLSEIIQVTDSVLEISDFDAVINPQTGPIVYQGESIDFSYSLTPIDKSVTLKPTLKLYDRVDNPDALKQTIELESIVVDKERNTYTVSLPTDLEPAVYYGVLSFKDEEGIESFSTSFRYIISGPIATIRNITSDALKVKKGKTFNVSVSYGGQPIDEYRPEKQLDTASSTITITATNEKGEHVSSVTQILDLNNEEKIVTIPMIAQNSAQELSFSAKIETQDGKILDEYSTVLPTEDSLKNQKSLLDKSSFNLITIISIIILLILILIVIFLKKKYESLNISLTIIAGAIIISSLIYGVSSVSALTIVPVTDKGVTENFDITAVISPLPDTAGKIYEPGEKFKLDYQATYGDCNNHSRRYRAWGYLSDSEWWKKDPRNNAGFKSTNEDDVADRIAYWDAQGSTMYDDAFIEGWKPLFMATDLVGLYSLSDKALTTGRATAIKKVVGLIGIQESKTCSRVCWTSTLKSELMTFDTGYYDWGFDYDDATYVSFAKNRKDTLELIKNTLVDAKKGGSDPVPGGLANFDFTNVKDLKVVKECKSFLGRESCDWRAGNDYTKFYIDKLKALESEARSFTSTALGLFYDNFSKGKHSTEITPVRLARVYTAPTTPGYHDLYFYLVQYGNIGHYEILAKQTICVRGAGVCKGEKQAMEISCSPGVTPVQAGENAVFSSEVKNNIGKTTYTWKLNGTEVSSAKAYSIPKAAKGTYKPTLTISDSTGRSKTVNCTQLVVQDPLEVWCSITDTTATANVTGRITGNPFTYSWKIDNQPTGFTGSTATIARTQTKATVTVKDTKTGATASHSCSRGGVIALSCSADPERVLPEKDATFTPVVGGGTAPFTYKWTAANGQVIGDTKILKNSWVTVGTKTVTFEVTDGNGKSDSESCSVEVGCGNKTDKMIENEECVNGVRTVYTCTPDGWRGEEESCGGAFLCKVSSRNIDIGDPVTYTATNVADATYDWFAGESTDGNRLSSWNSNPKTIIYSSTGLYKRSVKASVSGIERSDICPSVFVGCGTRPTGGETFCPDGSVEKEYQCQEDGWGLVYVNTCGGGGIDKDPVRKTFKFDPDTISSIGGKCSLYAEVEDTKGCQIKDRFGELVATYASDVANKVKITGNPFDVGTYSLECKGVGSTKATYTKLDTKSCYSNPDIKER